jgi:hypothetical protein
MKKNDMQMIAASPQTLIVPLGGLEYIDDALPFDGPSQICAALAESVCDACGALQAPMQNYTYTLPFKNLPGSIPLQKKTALRMMVDIITGSASWNATSLVFLDQGILYQDLAAEVRRKYATVLPENVNWTCISWQNLPALRQGVSARFADLKELWHSEAALLFLYRELFAPDLKIAKRTTSLVPKHIFTRWKKTGMDPEKLRKYRQTYELSVWTGVEDYSPLFPEVSRALCEKIQNNLEL